MVILSAEYIKHATGEFDLETIFQAILSGLSIERIDGLNKCCNLRWLDLSKNTIIWMENLVDLVHLVHLDLSDNKIHKVEGLEGMPILENLRLRSNPIARLQDLEGLRAGQKLRHLQFRNIDGTDFCPVCFQSDYQSKIFELCPDLVALDSQRRHLPNLEAEVHRLEKHEITLPEITPWLDASDLNLDAVEGGDAVWAALQPHLDEFDTAVGNCREMLREAEALHMAHEMAQTGEK